MFTYRDEYRLVFTETGLLTEGATVVTIGEFSMSSGVF